MGYDLKCPQCGCTNDLRITGHATYLYLNDGVLKRPRFTIWSDTEGDADNEATPPWDWSAPCTCGECGQEGTVEQFRRATPEHYAPFLLTISGLDPTGDWNSILPRLAELLNESNIGQTIGRANVLANHTEEGTSMNIRLNDISKL